VKVDLILLARIGKYFAVRNLCDL